MRTSSIEEEEKKKTRWHTRRARMRNAMRKHLEFSISDKFREFHRTNSSMHHRVRKCFLGKYFNSISDSRISFHLIK